MNTSATHFLSKPSGCDQIDHATFAYMRQRNRGRAYNNVINEFEKSALTQVDLAKRLGKTPAQVSRWLASPGNWTMDTYSDLLFAISGAEPESGVSHPLEPVSKYSESNESDNSSRLGVAKHRFESA